MGWNHGGVMVGHTQDHPCKPECKNFGGCLAIRVERVQHDDGGGIMAVLWQQ